MPDVDDMYLPVLVGASKNAKANIKYQRDDDGFNISLKNSSYSELTAVYWAWKNLHAVDAVGLVHYRRFFLKRFHCRKIENVLTKDDISKILKNYDLILPQKRKYFIETNYSHYIHAHHKEPLDETRNIILKMYPEYLAAFDKVMSKRSAHMFNMFVMKENYFTSYCKWLFDILNSLDKNIDISEYTTQEKRVFGYISELLMDVWIETKRPHYKEVKWGILGKRQIIKKAYYFIKRKMGLQAPTHF